MWRFNVGGSIGKLLYGSYMYPALTAQKYIELGTNVFSFDWDVLLVLDACRVDALRSVSEEYSFLNTVDPIWSVGSTSKEWYVNTFSEKDVSDVALVSGNAWTEHLFETKPNWKYWTATRGSAWHNITALDKILHRELPDSKDFKTYVPVIGNHGGDIGTTPLPDEVTDAAIHTGRNTDFDRMIVHYMQPHEPYIHERTGNDLPSIHKSPFQYLRSDDATFEEVYEGYLGNLRAVLDSVERLQQNLDAATVAITADHGELFGEWGMYTHPAAFPHPKLRKVPWVTTEASDTGESSVEGLRTIPDVKTEDRLQDLGYI